MTSTAPAAIIAGMANTTTPRDPDDITFSSIAAGIALILVVLLLLLGLIMGGIWGFKAFSRTQRVADAKTAANVTRIKADNDVTVMNTRIRQQEQKVQVAKQEAEIRAVEAEGLRKAQETQAASITPLFVQLRQVEALEEIAKDGKNATVVYIPSGSGGIPLVAGAGSAPQVTGPYATAR